MAGKAKAVEKPISGTQAIREYFDFGSIRLLKEELSGLTPEERKELGKMAAEALGKTLKVS